MINHHAPCDVQTTGTCTCNDTREGMNRWTIWKHDCIKHGMGDGLPCLPRCDDPWQADDPKNKWNNTFASWDEAIRWADTWARRRA